MNSKKTVVGILCSTIVFMALASHAVGTGSFSWNYRITGISTSALSDDGERFLVGCEDGYYYLFDQFGNVILNGNLDKKIHAVDIAENGNMVFGIDNGVVILDSGGTILSDHYSATPVLCVSITGNGLYAIAGTQSYIIMMSTHGYMWQYRIEDGDSPEIFVNEVVISITGSTVLAAVQDEVFIFSAMSAAYKDKINVRSNITSLDICSDRGSIAIGTEKGTISVYNTSGIEKFQYPLTGSISSMGMSERNLLVGTSEGEVVLFSYDGNILLERKTEGSVIECDVSDNGEFIVIMDSEGSVSFFNALTENGWKISIREPIFIELSKNGKYVGIIGKSSIFFLNNWEDTFTGTEFFPFASHGRFSLEDDLYSKWMPYLVKDFGGFDYGDINGDGLNEVTLGSGTELLVLDCQGKLVWEKSFSAKIGFVSLYDLTRDAVPEIIIGFDNGQLDMYIWSGEGELLRSFDFMNLFGVGTCPGSMSIITAMDIDKDGMVEIISEIESDHPLKPRGILVFEYPSGAKEWFYPTAPFGLSHTLTDINNDGNQELVFGSYSHCSGNMVGNRDDCHVYITTIDLKGNEIWAREIAPGFKKLLVGVSDLDNNGRKEIIGTIGSLDNTYGELFILNNMGEYICRKEFDYSIWFGGVADFEKDGYQEIVIATNKGEVAMYDCNLTLLKEFEIGKYLNSYINGIVDLDGDRSLEIVVTTDEGKLIVVNSDFVEMKSLKFDGRPEVIISTVCGCAVDLLVCSSNKLELYSMKKERKRFCCLIEEEERRIRLIEIRNPQKEAERYFEVAETSYKNLEFEDAAENYEKARILYTEIQSIGEIIECSNKIERSEKLQKALNKMKDGVDKLNTGDLKSAIDDFFESKIIFEELLQNEDHEETKNWLRAQITECEGWLGAWDEISEAIRDLTNGKAELDKKNIENAKENLDSALQIFQKHELEQFIDQTLKYQKEIEDYLKRIEVENEKKRYFLFFIIISWISLLTFQIKWYKSISMLKTLLLFTILVTLSLLLIYFQNLISIFIPLQKYIEIVMLTIFLVAILVLLRYLPNTLYRNENYSILKSFLYTFHLREFPTFSPISNLYDTSNPIKEKDMFFGREDLFLSLKGKITSPDKNFFIILHGENKAGKTSFLFQIENGKFKLGSEFIPVYINLSEMLINDDYGFLLTLNSAIQETFILNGIEIPPISIKRTKYPYLHFKNNTLLDITNFAGEKCILFLMDEYEVIGRRVAMGLLSRDVFIFLNDLIEHNTRINFIFAGSRKIEQLRNIDEWELLKNASEEKEISFLKEEEAIRLIREPVADKVWYTNRAIRELLELSGCHPYILQCFCFNLIVSLNETSKYTVDIKEVKEVMQNMIESPNPQLLFMWKTLSKDQQKILSFLAGVLRKKGRSMSEKRIISAMKRNNIEFTMDPLSILYDLRDKTILKKENNKFMFCMGIFRCIIAEHYPLSRVLQEVET